MGLNVLQPLRDIGLFVDSGSLAASLIAGTYTLDAYPMAVSALLLVVPTLALSARLEHSPRLVNAAIIVGVAAAYLTLFELGRGRSGHVSSLGVLASLLAVALWGIERFASPTMGRLASRVYQVGRIGMEHAMAKWAILLVLGIGLVLFVALNEKRRFLSRIRKFVGVARQWD